MSIKNFLNEAVAASLQANDDSIKAISEEILTAKKEMKEALIFKIKAAIAVMLFMRMIEEVQLFGQLISLRCAQRLITVPEEIEKLFADAKPAPVPAIVPPPPVQVQAPATPPVPQVKPANLSPKPAPQGGMLGEWKDYLNRVIAGEVMNLKSVTILTTRVFKGNLSSHFTVDDWQLFFDAMMAAQLKGGHILAGQADPYKVFKQAPADLVNNVIFGKDGLFSSLVIAVDKDKEEVFPLWLAAKASTVLDGIDVVDATEDFRMDEDTFDQVKMLLSSIRAKKGVPDWLTEKMDQSFPPNPEEDAEEMKNVHEGAKLEHRPLAEGLAGFKPNGQPETPVLQ